MNRYITLTVLVLAASAAAQQPANLTLDECLHRAGTFSPVVRAGSVAVEKARIMQGTAFDPDMTEVSLTQETTTGDSPDNGVNFTQAFDFPTLYVARHKALKAETALAGRTLDSQKAQVEREVTSLYYTMLHARNRVKLLALTDSTFTSLLNLTSSRYTNGEVSRLDVINARQLAAACRADYHDAVDSYYLLTLKMQNLLGAECPVEPAAADTLSALPLPAAGEYSFATTVRGREADAGVELSRRNLSVARNEFAPSISLSATTRCLIKSFNPYDVEREAFKGHFMKFEVGVGVPLFFGARRARARAAARDLTMARLDRESAETEAVNEYLAARSEMLTAAHNLEYHTTTGASEADELERLATVSYTLGEINEIELIQYLQSVSDMRSRHADAIERYNQSVINLKYLSK
ncbi:MAG: TolC family protein [Bacteroides sp.]|nr:TolC family protein [Barnesiella sp.]MBD5368333.1 TolC family protein [Bacteroides sp.]